MTVPLNGLIIRAAALLEGTQCQSLSTDEAVVRLRDGEHPLWLDVQFANAEVANSFLTKQLGFHELAVEDALSTHERPSLQEFGEQLFLVVPAIDGNEFVEVAFFLMEKSLVTVASRPLRVLDQWFDRWTDHPQRLGSHPAHLMHALIDGIIDDYFPMVDNLEDEIDEVGDNIFRGETDHVAEILMLKRKLLEVRRRLIPVRDIMNGLLRRDLAHIPDSARPYFQDVYDHTLRVTEQADINRETLASLLDVHLSTVSNNLNEIVKKMTVVSTILMSAALVAGIYGMNFEHMPELKWAIGYPMSLLAMVVIAVVELVVFRLIRWI
jgi:magnesium transporter